MLLANALTQAIIVSYNIGLLIIGIVLIGLGLWLPTVLPGGKLWQILIVIGVIVLIVWILALFGIV
jgi:uncharacterized protein (DUF983 family)